MNTDFVRWLLNIKAIPKESEGLRLAWEHPWPSWLWAILFIIAGLFAVWSYSRLSGHRLGRGFMAAARFVLILLVLIFISGPMLELPRETLEQDWVLMLADRSASMSIQDGSHVSGSGGSDQGSAARISRDEQLRAALQAHAEVFSDLANQKNVVWLGFHAGAFNLASDARAGGLTNAVQHSSDASQAPAANATEATLPELGDADGRRSDLESALQQALQRAAARQVSGVVVFSDGRADAIPSRSIVRRLTDEQIRVYVVPLGSPDPLGDLAIRSIEAPSRAFIRDKVPVIVEIEGRGVDPAQLGTARIKLVDQLTGETLDEQPLDPQALAQSSPGEALAITLTAEPSLAGEATWVAMIESNDAPSGGVADLIPENNSRPMHIELIDRPLRVLYVEGYPRWEYHYVKSLLIREKTIESSVMLISADRDFAQEGNQPITRLPRSSEEFAQFDVIILGDVPATFFSPPQLDMIRAHVADRGAGLLWIAGPRYVPSTFAGTALADLLPMRGSLKLQPIEEPVTMTSTPLAQRLGVLQLETESEMSGVGSASLGAAHAGSRVTGWPQELVDPATGWSRLYYAQRIEPGLLKPAAEVLAHTVNAYGGSHLPLVMNMRYGAGQTLYVATDEIWRWRYGRGELLPNQFWMQMIRMLGRESLTSDEPALVAVTPRRVAVGQPMRIEVRLLDAQLMQSDRSTVRVTLETEQGQRIGEIELQRVEGSEDRFAATYLPDGTGNLRVRIDDATMPTVRVQSPAEVYAPDDELQRPQTNHELLASLARATGGRVVQPNDLEELRTLPNRAVRTINPLSEPIWDSPLAFMLALLVITFEWVGRKVLRLV